MGPWRCSRRRHNMPEPYWQCDFPLEKIQAIRHSAAGGVGEARTRCSARSALRTQCFLSQKLTTPPQLHDLTSSTRILSPASLRPPRRPPASHPSAPKFALQHTLMQVMKPQQAQHAKANYTVWDPDNASGGGGGGVTRSRPVHLKTLK